MAYHPRIYILPPRGIRRFSDFTCGMLEDLLLREPDFYFSSSATEGDSRSYRGYGAMTARDWHDELPTGVRDIIDKAGFSLFCYDLSRHIASQTLLGALVERWWDTTNFFHLSSTGEMTMTPYDFAMLTVLGVRGDLIPVDTDIGEWEVAWIHLLGAHPSLYRSAIVRYSWFTEQFRGSEPKTPEEMEQYVWGFLMLLLGTTLFLNRWNTVGLYLLSTLVTLPRGRFYDWGGVGLYGYMNSTFHMMGE
ncbi:protein MAIN-LIKE 2-like [Camellia sinensis]|uniref:protein MAIN-LIKE 2-like n=1 Tax=Camellia sinensis TaxID=4442 RepID=UPI0010367A04|nr:protein MAIN-LIKE 2-like [Camellia sinensis]